jgi:hypothetical protein
MERRKYQKTSRLSPVSGILIVDDGHYVAIVLVQGSVIVALVKKRLADLAIVGIKAADLKAGIEIIPEINSRHVALIFRAAGIVGGAGKKTPPGEPKWRRATLSPSQPAIGEPPVRRSTPSRRCVLPNGLQRTVIDPQNR